MLLISGIGRKNYLQNKTKQAKYSTCLVDIFEGEKDAAFKNSLLFPAVFQGKNDKTCSKSQTMGYKGREQIQEQLRGQ